MDAHQSQFYEWLPWVGGYADEVPKDPAERKKWVGKRYSSPVTPELRARSQVVSSYKLQVSGLYEVSGVRYEV